MQQIDTGNSQEADLISLGTGVINPWHARKPPPQVNVNVTKFGFLILYASVLLLPSR